MRVCLSRPACLQVMAHADTAYFMGYIDPMQRVHAMAMQAHRQQPCLLYTSAGFQTANEQRC
jgi:hypothetical protein